MKRFDKPRMILVLLITGISLSSFSQEIPKIIPPSPDAASLGKYGDIQVGTYTGVPNITVPLYNLKIRDASLPIGISYHASGIRVEEEASWVGLGWTLSAGGAITRTVRGLDDLLNGSQSKGYVYSTQEVESSPTGVYLNDVCKKKIDSQPDVFYFNFAGHSGKFFLNRKISGVINVRLLSNNEKMKVDYNETDGKWTIWTSDGTRFIFGTKEYTETWPAVVSPTNGAGPPPNDIYTTPPNEEHELPVISTWYLDKIISPTNETIDFTYSNARQSDGKQFISKSIPQWNEIRNFCVGLGSKKPGTFNPCPLLSSPFNALYGHKFGFVELKKGYNNYFDFSCIYDNTTDWQWINYGTNHGVECNASLSFSGSHQVYKNYFLSQITFSTGRISFSTSDRDDIQESINVNTAVPYAKPQKLDLITIEQNKNGTFETIKKISFQYSYFNAGAPATPQPYLDKRLKLESVQEFNGTQSVPPHVFVYEQTVNLPAKNSKSKDHWGFFNGADNSTAGFAYQPTILPVIKYKKQDGTIESFPGANREADEIKSQANILKKIIYPTKGYTTFTYESNTFNIDQVSTNLPTQNFQAYVESPASPASVFELTQSVPVTFNVEFKCLGLSCYPGGTPPDPTINCDNVINTHMNEYYVTVRNIATGEIVFKGLNFEYFCKNGAGTCPEPNIGVTLCGIQKQRILTLPAGKYLINATPPVGFKVVASARYDLYQQVTSYSTNIIIKGGGLRIKDIRNHDGISSKNDRLTQYKYHIEESNGLKRSTGKLMTFPKYAYGEYREAPEFNGSVTIMTNLRTHSYSNIPLGSSASGHAVGYDQVEEVFGANGENGKNIYYYKNDPEEERSPYFPNAPTITHSPSNGLLKRLETFDAYNIKVKELENNYLSVADPNALNGILILNYSGSCYPPEMPTSDWLFAYIHFSEPSEWWYLDNSIERIFDANVPSKNMEKTTTYFYNTNHKMPIKTITTDSEGREVRSETRYPLDEVALADSHMWNEPDPNYKHMHNSVIKNELYVNGTRTNGSINSYSFDNVNNIVTQSRVDVSPTGGAYETRLNFDRYDSKGNVLQVSKSNDISVSFIWGYNKTLPIAKINNATYAQIESVLTAQDLLDLNGNTLTNDQIKLKLQGLYTALPQAQILIYLYEPLAGVVKVIDENQVEKKFEYDDLKRLINVFDNDLQPVLKYKYGYKQN